MADFKKSVSEQIMKKVQDKGKDKVRDFWNSIYSWYNEGGEAKMKQEISSMLKAIKEKFDKEYEKIENKIESI